MYKNLLLVTVLCLPRRAAIEEADRELSGASFMVGCGLGG